MEWSAPKIGVSLYHDCRVFSLLQRERTLNWLMAKSVLFVKTQSTVAQEKIVSTVRTVKYGNKLIRKVTVFPVLTTQNWISLWANCCRLPCSEQGWDEAHSRGAALWFCESVSSSAHSILIGPIRVGCYINPMSMSDDKKRYSSILFSSITVTY